MKKALVILCTAGCLLGCNRTDNGARVDRGLKDEHIRHQLTAMIPDLSYRAPWPGAIQEALANLDALASVESSKCSVNQRNLLRATTANLRVVLEDWNKYKIHAAHDSDPAEEKKAHEAMQDCSVALGKAKQTLTEAAATF